MDVILLEEDIINQWDPGKQQKNRDQKFSLKLCFVLFFSNRSTLI